MESDISDIQKLIGRAFYWTKTINSIQGNVLFFGNERND
jgi:hypothetical protein